jgi:hypothetical protein
MAAAIDRGDAIDPCACRDWVTAHCDADAVALAYERVYRLAVHSDARRLLAYA